MKLSFAMIRSNRLRRNTLIVAFLVTLSIIVNLKLDLLARPTLEQQDELELRQLAVQNKTNVSNKTTTKPLNIVLFYADDWTMKVLGKLNPRVITPNIDQLADHGVLFNKNAVTTSVCWMSRATLMTGLYSARHRQTHISKMDIFNRTNWNETLFPLLKTHGYYNGIVGKWHAPGPTEYMDRAFDFRRLYYGQHWFQRGNIMKHVTTWNEEDAMFFLDNRPRDRPFALKISFFATHAWDSHYPSYIPTNESRALYMNATIEVPKTATDKHWKELPWFFDERNAGRGRWKKRFEPTYYEDNIKNLYALATEVDAVIGNVIKQLKKQGVYNQTLLIFTTDNGNLHGEHGLAEKWYAFEESIRVPLVIQDPRMPASVQGTQNDALTLNIDLAPTILAAAQIEIPGFMQGQDISSLYLRDPKKSKASWRQGFFYEYNQGEPNTAKGHNSKFYIPAVFAFINYQWKYIYWPEHDYEQLFHIDVDPYEERDLLGNATRYNLQTTETEYQAIKKEYARLKKLAQGGSKV